MSTDTRTVAATPEQVWNILADGWLYPLFVVGASRMREVDDGWPAQGALLHHSVGAWPLLIDDTTEVLECEPGVMLKLRANAWPLGAAHVVMRLRPTGSKTEIVMEEDAVSGPGRLMPKPLRDVQLHPRNQETLRRLGYLAERRK
jgi:hypothetical protein